jgi:hypothetical protein
MSTLTSQSATTVLAPPSSTPSKQELIAEAIDCIISGRPYPEHLRPTTYAAERPRTVEAGITRILRGGPAAPCH